LALSFGILADGRPILVIRCVKACSLVPRLRSNRDSYEPCGWRMTYGRHLVATFAVSRHETVRPLRHSAVSVGLRSVPEACSHCGKTVPRSEAHARVITFWAVFAHLSPDDDGMTLVLIWSSGPRSAATPRPETPSKARQRANLFGALSNRRPISARIR
jgi:hypothetical protein